MGLKPSIPAYAADAAIKGWVMKKSSAFPYGWHRRYAVFLSASKVLLLFSTPKANSDKLVLRGELLVRSVGEGIPRPLLHFGVTVGPTTRVTAKNAESIPRSGTLVVRPLDLDDRNRWLKTLALYVGKRATLSRASSAM